MTYCRLLQKQCERRHRQDGCCEDPRGAFFDSTHLERFMFVMCFVSTVANVSQPQPRPLDSHSQPRALRHTTYCEV